MKLSHIVVGSCLTGLSYASTPNAYLFPFDVSTQDSSTPSPSLSPVAAQLLLAQRLGSSNTFSLDDIDEDVILSLNRYGGAQRTLLENDGDDQPLSKLLLVLEGRDSIIDEYLTPSIKISNPRNLINDEFLGELLQQDLSSNSFRKHCSYSRAVHHSAYASLEINLPDAISCPSKESILPQTVNDDDFVHPLKHLEALAKRGVSSWAAPGATATLKISISENLSSDAIKEFVNQVSSNLKVLASSGNQESTILLLPKQSGEASTWSFLGRRQQPEEPLSLPQAQESRTKSPSSSASTSTSQPHVSRPIKHSSTLSFPLCSTSNSTCLAATNNCTGHGLCVLKSQTKEGDSKVVDCWSCKCAKTFHLNADGTTKAIYWTGPACQKKDISMPFWLLAGISIMLISFVSYGIGLLISVGDTELPSVLGAGVSSARPK